MSNHEPLTTLMQETLELANAYTIKVEEDPEIDFSKLEQKVMQLNKAISEFSGETPQSEFNKLKEILHSQLAILEKRKIEILKKRRNSNTHQKAQKAYQSKVTGNR